MKIENRLIKKMTDEKKKKKNAFDDVLEELEEYDKECDPRSLLDSGE